MLDELPSDICTQLLEILLSSGSVRDFLSLCSTCSLMHKLGLLLLPGQTDLPVPRCIHQVASDFSWRSQLLAEAKACANKPASQAKVDTSSFFAPAKGDAEDTRAVISDGSQLALYNRYMELLRGWLPHHTHRQFSQRQAAVQNATISSSLPSYSACTLLLLQPLKPLPTHSGPILSAAEWPPQPFSRPRLPLPPCLPAAKPPLSSPLHQTTSSRIREGGEVDLDAPSPKSAAAERYRQSPRNCKDGCGQGDSGWPSPRSAGWGAVGGRGREGRCGRVGRGIDFGGSVVAVPRPPPPAPPPTPASAAAAAKLHRKRSEQGKEAGPELAQEDVAFQMLTRIPCLPSTTYLDISHHSSLSDTDLAVVLGKCTRGLRHLSLAGTQAGQCTLLQLGAKGNHNVQALDLSSLSAIGTHNPLPPPDLRTPAPAAGITRCPAPRSHHSAHEVRRDFQNGREMGSACQRDAAPTLRSSSAVCDPPVQPSWACSGSSSSSSSGGGGGGNTESRGWSQGEAYVMSQAVRNGSSGVQDRVRARACSSSPVRGSRSAVEQRQQKLQGSYRGVSSVDLVSGHLGHWGLRHRHPSVLAAEIESRRHSANTSNDACEAFGAAVNGGVSDARAGNDAAEGAVDDDDADGDDGGDECPSDKQAAGVEEHSSQVLTSAAVKAAARPPDPAVPHVPHASMPPGSLPALWRPQTRPVPSPWRLPLGGKGRDRQQREGQHVGPSGSSSSWSGGEHAVFVRLLRCTLERLPGLQDLRLCSNHLWGLFDPLPFSPPQKKPRPQAQGPEPQDLELHQQQCPPVSPLLRSLANLRVLHLAGSTGLWAQSLALLLLHCPNLLDLDVHQCIDLNAITSGTSLAELLQPQASCLPSLRRLRGGWGLCTASLQLLLCHPGRAYALTSLNLGLGAGVNDALMGQLAGACTNLQEVKLTLASVTDQGIHDLLLGCRKLHVLVLLHCLGPFTPALLPSGPPILQQQPQQQESAPERGHRWTLTNLQLMGGRCTLLSSHVSQLIGSRPNTLHTLALSNCPYITPALLDFLASRHQDSLRHVRLEQCGGYSWVQPCNGVSQPPGPHTPARGSQEGCCANESAFSFQEGSFAQESASACQEGGHAKEGFRFAKESVHISESQGGGCGTNRGDCRTECGGCNNCDAQGGSCSTNRGGCHTECGGCNKCTTHGGSCSTNAGGFHTESGGCIKWGTQGKGCSAVNDHCHTSRHTHGEERPSSHCNEPSDGSSSTNTDSHISWQSPAAPTQPCDAQAPCPAASTRSCDPTESPSVPTQPCDAQAPCPAASTSSRDPTKSPAAPTSHTPKASSSAMPNGPATSLPPFQSPAPQQTPPLPASRLSASVWPIDEASITQLAAACTRLCSLHLRHCCQLSAGVVEELTSTCPHLSSVLVDRCDLRDGGVRCPQSSFHLLHRIMVARCRQIEPSLIPQPLFGPATPKSSTQTKTKEGLGLALNPEGATSEVPIRHHHVDTSVMVHDLRAGGTAVLHAG